MSAFRPLTGLRGRRESRMPPSSQLLLWLALFFCFSRSAAAVASSTTASSRLLLDLHLKHWRWYRNLRNLLQEFGHPDSRAETRYKRALGGAPSTSTAGDRLPRSNLSKAVRGQAADAQRPLQDLLGTDEELPGRRIPVVHRPVLYDQQARIPRPLTGYPHSSTRFAWEEERQVWGEMSRVEIVELPEECYAENSPEHPSFFLFYGAARRESVVGGTFPAHWLTSAFKESWLHGYNYHLKEGYDVYDHLESTAEKLTATKAAEAAAIAAAEAAAENAETGEAETTTNEPPSSSSTTTSTSTTTSDTQVTTPFKGKIVKNPINFFVTAYDEQDAKYQDFFFRAEDRTNSIGVGKNTDRWAPKALLGMLADAREERRKKREEGEDAAGEMDDESAVVEQFESLFYRHLFENTLAAEAAAAGAANANATTADVCGVTASAGGGLAVAPCSHQSHARTASPTAGSQDSTDGAEPQALAALAGVDVSPHGSAVIADAYRAISGQDPIILRRMGYIKNIFKGTIFQKFQRNLTAIAGEFSEAVADLLHHSAPEVFADEMGKNPAGGAIAADAAPPEDALLARLAAVKPEHAAPLQALETGGVELFPQRECMGLAYVISRLVEEEYALMGFITAVSSGQIKSSMLRESLDKRFRLQIGRWLTIILDDIVYDTHLFGFFDSKMLLLEEKLQQQGRKSKGRRGTKRFVRQPNYEAERLSHRDRILERSRFTDTLSQILHVTEADLDVETTDHVEADTALPAGESSALPSSAEQEGPPPENTPVDLDALLREQLAQRPRELLTPKFRYAFLPQYIKQNGRAFHRRVQSKSHFAKEEESLLVAFLGHVMQREKLLRILAAWVHDLRYLFDFLGQKIEAEVHLSTNSRAVDKSRITKRHEDWKVESMNQLYSEPTGGFPVPFMAETTLMNLRAGGEARKSQMKEYHLANVFFRHVKEAFDRHFLAVESEEGSGGNGSATTSGRTSTAEPKRQSSAWFPVGGTYIGFLRYGSLQGFHANGRLDIPDADIDLMVTLDEGPEGLSPRDPSAESRDEELEGHEQEQDRLQTRLAELSFMIREEGRYTLKHGTVEEARADAENSGAEGVEAVPERQKPKVGPAGRTSGLREECRTRLAMEYYAGSHPVPEAGGGDVVTEPAATAPVCSSAQYDLIRESRAIQSRLAELEKARVQKQDAFLDKDLADPRVRAEFGVSYKEYEKYQSFLEQGGEGAGGEKGKAEADKLKRQLLRPGRRVTNYHAYAANRVFLLSEELVNRFGWAGCRMGDQKLTCYQRAFGILDEVNFYVEVAFLKPLRVVNIPGPETTTSSGRLVYVHCDYLNVAADHDGALVPRSFELLHEIYFPESFFPLRPCHGWGSMVKCPNTFDTLEDYDLPYAKQNAVRYSDYAVLGTFHGNRSHPSPTSIGALPTSIASLTGEGPKADVAEPGVLEYFRLQETIAARHSRGDSPFPQPGITRDAVFQRLAAGGDEAGGSVDANSLSAISLQIMATATDITAVDIAAQALPQRQAQEGPSTGAASPNSVTSKVARYEEYQAGKVDVVAHQHVVVERRYLRPATETAIANQPKENEPEPPEVPIVASSPQDQEPSPPSATNDFGEDENFGAQKRRPVHLITQGNQRALAELRRRHGAADVAGEDAVSRESASETVTAPSYGYDQAAALVIAPSSPPPPSPSSIVPPAKQLAAEAAVLPHPQPVEAVTSELQSRVDTAIRSMYMPQKYSTSPSSSTSSGDAEGRRPHHLGVPVSYRPDVQPSFQSFFDREIVLPSVWRREAKEQKKKRGWDAVRAEAPADAHSAEQSTSATSSTGITFGVRMAFRFCHEVVRRKANEVGEVPCIVIHLCTEWLGKMGFVKRLADVIGQTGDAISNSEEVPPQSTVSAEEEEVPKPEDLELWLLEQDRFKLPRKTAESFFVSTPEWRHYLQIMNSVCGSIGPIPLKELQPLELVILLSYYPGNADKYAFFASLIRQHKGYETRNYYTNELVGLFADVLTKNLTASVLDRAKIGQPRSLDSLLLDIYFEEVLARFGHEVDNLEAKAFNWTSVTHETRRRRDGVRHLLLARNESMESSHEPFSSGLCLGIADCFVRKKKRDEAEKAAAARGPAQGHQLQLQEEDMTTQCQEDRHFVFHHPASKKFLQTPMVLQDMVTLLKYNLALTFKGAASHDLGLCDVRYYVRAPA